MNHELSPNTQAILLLTAPLLKAISKPAVKPLTFGQYSKLAMCVWTLGKEPKDLHDSALVENVTAQVPKLEPERVQRLMARGFSLSQALERWRARSIWVVTRADRDYPRRLKKRLREDAPPVLYGCGERGLVTIGGLAVVGSRRVDEDLIEYTQCIGRLAAETNTAIVSGGARGVDQAAMGGALDMGGHALGILANDLDRAVLNQDNLAWLRDGRLSLICPYDPAVRFHVGLAMQRNKFIYALADAALVVNSDLGRGGTWAGATEQLRRYRWVPVYVRRTGVSSAGLDALEERGAQPWPEPQTPVDLLQIVAGNDIQFPESEVKWEEAPSKAEPHEELATKTKPRGPSDWEANALIQEAEIPGEMEPSESDSEAKHSASDIVTRSGSRTDVLSSKQGRLELSYSDDEEEPQERAANKSSHDSAYDKGGAKAAKRLLPRMQADMSRKEICVALKLKNWGHVNNTIVKPCLNNGWVKMTIPETPRSPKQRFRLTPEGKELAATFDDNQQSIPVER